MQINTMSCDCKRRCPHSVVHKDECISSLLLFISLLLRSVPTKLKVCIRVYFFLFFFFLNFIFTFYICIVSNGISPMGNSGCFPGESLLRQSRATQPTVHAGCFSVSIIHRTLTWTSYMIFKVHTDVNTCDRTRGYTDTRKRVCTES